MTALAVYGVLALAFAVAVYFVGRSNGTDAVKRAQAEHDTEAAERIAEVRAQHPLPRNALIDRLRDPERGL